MQTVWGARAGIVFADAWMWSPFVMLLVLAGLVSVPEVSVRGRRDRPCACLAAVLVDHLPLYPRPSAAGAAVRTIEAFKLFDLVFLLTNGGPGTATETIALRVYRVAFENNKTSESTALAYILLFTVIVLTNLYLYFANQRQQSREA